MEDIRLGSQEAEDSGLDDTSGSVENLMSLRCSGCASHAANSEHARQCLSSPDISSSFNGSYHNLNKRRVVNSMKRIPHSSQRAYHIPSDLDQHRVASIHRLPASRFRGSHLNYMRTNKSSNAVDYPLVSEAGDSMKCSNEMYSESINSDKQQESHVRTSSPHKESSV